MTTSNDSANVQAAAPPQRLGDLLLSSKLVTDAQLAECQEESTKTGAFLCKVLVQNGYITQDDINACFVKMCKIPHISLLDYDVGADVLQLIPEEVCMKYGLLPIDKLGRILTVAMVDPLDPVALETIRAHCSELRLKPILCNWAHFEQVSKKYFGGSGKKDGGGNESMASFGLSSLPPKAAPKATTPAPKPAASEAAPAQAAGQGNAPALDTAALVGAIQEGLRSIASEMAARQPAAAPAPHTDFSGLESAFRSALNDFKETLRQPASGTAAAAPAAGPSDLAIQELVQAMKSQAPPGDVMAEVIRESVGGAMQEALASVVVQLRANQKADQDPPSLDRFAETIRDTIGGVMQEAMASFLVQSRNNTGSSETAAAQHEAMLAAMREVVEAARDSQEAQGAKLAALAEAAVQTTQQTSQLVEASLVQNERVNNLRQGNRARHASVSAFGNGPAEGSEDPEQAAEDAKVRDALDAEVPLGTLTFDTFFPGKSNAFTAQISQTVAQSPGGEYNPFFLYGNVGLGKTHLVSAVGNHIQKTNPKHRVGYVSASHFSRRLKDALAAGAQDAFRENYCHWDVLILDDIQFMGGRVEAQEEFFHIFNVLHQQGRQIIIASDKAPDRLGLLEQRLVSRFSSGIVAELKPPEWETRMQILKHHVAASNVTIPEEICSLIAMRVANDIRKMVGSLRKVIAFAGLSKEPVTVEMATEILSHLGGEEAA